MREFDPRAGVALDVIDRVARMRFTRPEARNMLTPTMVQAIADGLETAAAADVGALVISAEGSCFCAGIDLAAVGDLLDQDRDGGPLWELITAWTGLIERLQTLPFPTVCAVQGPVLGPSMGLVMATDMRVMSRSARFVPAFLGIGMTPDGGTTFFLTRALGAAAMRALVVRNRPLPAAEMVALGLAEELVEDDAIEQAALALARSVTSTPVDALLAARRLIAAGTSNDLTTQLAMEREAASAMWRSTEYQTRIRRFVRG